MFFIPRIVFVRNVQKIYAIVAEWKNRFLEWKENKKELREFKEKCFITRWKSQLNTDQ